MYDVRLAEVRLEALQKARDDLERAMRSSELENLSARRTATAILTCKKVDIELEISKLTFQLSLYR
jgi:hypothetical protein